MAPGLSIKQHKSMDKDSDLEYVYFLSVLERKHTVGLGQTRRTTPKYFLLNKNYLVFGKLYTANNKQWITEVQLSSCAEP